MDDDFLAKIMAAPEDRAVLSAYADWLKAQRDPREGYLRLPHSKQRKLRNRLDADWLAFMDNLGEAFRPLGDQELRFPAADLPFKERLGTRGGVVLFESDFRDTAVFSSDLMSDLGFLTRTEWGDAYYGATTPALWPFLCEVRAEHPLTGRAVLDALRPTSFHSAQIASLDADYIPYRGYHPNDDGRHNDEVHSDFESQYLFQSKQLDDDGEEVGPLSADEGVHGLLKRAVRDEKLWYVLLHATPRQLEGLDYPLSEYVMLIAVGLCASGDRLLGVIAPQVCHNLCD